MQLQGFQINVFNSLKRVYSETSGSDALGFSEIQTRIGRNDCMVCMEQPINNESDGLGRSEAMSCSDSCWRQSTQSCFQILVLGVGNTCSGSSSLLPMKGDGKIYISFPDFLRGREVWRKGI